MNILAIECQLYSIYKMCDVVFKISAYSQDYKENTNLLPALIEDQ